MTSEAAAPTPFRFLSRCARALAWFVRSSIVILRQSRPGQVDYDLTHRYASLLSSGWKRIFRLHHVVRNAERLASMQPCVYIANHRSNLDVITMCEILPPRTLVIGKKEVGGVPFLGKIFLRGGNVPINRKDPEEARLATAEAERLIREERLSMFIFPEGTRNYGTMKPFKKGAFHVALNAGVPIVPMVCAVTPGWFRGSRLYNAPTADVLLEVLDPIDPAAFGSVDEAIAEARGRMQAALARLEEEARTGRRVS